MLTSNEVENRKGSLRIASLQIPFIPTTITSKFNSFFEPDGGINFWLLGERHQKSEFFQVFLKNNCINTELPKIFLSEYINWITSVVEELLDYICRYEDPDIVLFPEYSLPVTDIAGFEDSQDLLKILIKYSENRCIIGGTGVISHDIKGHNRFIVVTNGNITFCSKKVPNDDEKDYAKSGNGPFIHELSLKDNKKAIIMVAMCSDFINSGITPESFQSAVNKEIEQMDLFKLLCKKYSHYEYIEDKIKGVIVDCVFVPCFTTKTDDMIKVMELQSVRGYRAVILSNCSFFGGAITRFSPYEKVEYKSECIAEGESGVIIADIPIPTHQLLLLKPLSKSMHDNELKFELENPIKNLFQFRKYNIDFDPLNEEDDIDIGNEIDRQTNDLTIEVYSGNFFDLIGNRLNASLIYLALMLMARAPNKDKRENIDIIIDLLDLWKSLQEGINSSKEANISTTYDQLPDILIPYIDQFIFKSGVEQYRLVLDQLDGIVDDKYKEYIRQIKTHIEDIKPQPFHFMSSEW